MEEVESVTSSIASDSLILAFPSLCLSLDGRVESKKETVSLFWTLSSFFLIILELCHSVAPKMFLWQVSCQFVTVSKGVHLYVLFSKCCLELPAQKRSSALQSRVSTCVQGPEQLSEALCPHWTVCLCQEKWATSVNAHRPVLGRTLTIGRGMHGKKSNYHAFCWTW